MSAAGHGQAVGLPTFSSRFVDLPGRNLHVLEWGDAAAPKIVLVHGMRDHAHSWDGIAAALARRFHVVVPDLRGHGDSDWTGSYDLPDYVRDLAELLEALGLPPASLVGHSLGGQAVLRYAACFPERVACLCVIEGVELPVVRQHRAAPRPYPSRLREWIGSKAGLALRVPRRYATFQAARARLEAAHPSFAPGLLDHLTRHGTVEEPAGFRWKYDNTARLRAPEDAHGIDLDETLAAISCPTLLVYGDLSWVDLPPPARLALLEHHRTVRFADASHWPHLQSECRFLEIIEAFLDKPAMFVKGGRSAHA